MGLEEKLPSGFLLTTVEKLVGQARAASVWPATFGLACCAIEMMATAGPRFDIEIVFLYPWAVAFEQLRLFGLLQMVVFLALVSIAYAYEWRRGGLEWD